MTKTKPLKKILVVLLAIMVALCFMVPATAPVHAAQNTETSNEKTTDDQATAESSSEESADANSEADANDEQAENETVVEDEPEVVVPGKVSNLVAATSSSAGDMKISDNFFGKREITLTWDPVSEADKYIVTKSLGKETVYETIGETSKTEMTFTLDKCSVAYFKVIAEKNKVQGEPSDWVSVVPGSAANSSKIDVKADAKKVDSTKTTKVTGTTDNEIDSEIRYATSDPTIATVDQDGTVTGVGGGEVTIYAVAHNGDRKGEKINVNLKDVYVPDVNGLTEKEAKELIRDSHLKMKVKDIIASEDELKEKYPKFMYGQVVEQDVKAGEVIAHDSEITVSVLKQDGAVTSDGRVLNLGGKLAWPLPQLFVLTSNFGHRSSPGGIGSTYHQGIDIGAPSGTSILAAKGGEVVTASWYGGYGNCVIIDHGDGMKTLYGHMSKITCNVGDKVNVGDIIGKVGSTGNSTGPHLHFGIMINGTFVDPLPYVRGGKIVTGGTEVSANKPDTSATETTDDTAADSKKSTTTETKKKSTTSKKTDSKKTDSKKKDSEKKKDTEKKPDSTKPTKPTNPTKPTKPEPKPDPKPDTGDDDSGNSDSEHKPVETVETAN